MAPEPRRGAGVVAALVVLVALGVAVSLTEFFVAPPYRQTAIRLFSALILLVAVSRVRAIVLASVERRAAWGEGALGDTVELHRRLSNAAMTRVSAATDGPRPNRRPGGFASASGAAPRARASATRRGHRRCSK